MDIETGTFHNKNNNILNENKQEQVRSLEIVANKDEIVQMIGGGENLNRDSPVSIKGDYSKDELMSSTNKDNYITDIENVFSLFYLHFGSKEILLE